MKFFRGIFWLIWIWAIVFLVVTFLSYKIYELILFLVLFALTGISIYLNHPHKKSVPKIKRKVESIDLSLIEERIKNMEKKEEDFSRRIFGIKTDLDQYKLDQERRYRDVVRKVLDLDNKLNKKFKLLGKSIIKISKKEKN